MKKYLALALAILMFSASVLGCGEAPTNEPTEETKETETVPETTESSESYFVDDWDEPLVDVDEESLERIPVDRETA